MPKLFFLALSLNLSVNGVCPSSEYFSFTDGTSQLQNIEILGKRGRTFATQSFGPASPFLEEQDLKYLNLNGFNRMDWIHYKTFGPMGGTRVDQCSNFLRQYKLIGMSRKQIENLLGPTAFSNKDRAVVAYWVFSNCTCSIFLELRYQDDIVNGFGLSPWRDEPPAVWITEDLKPASSQNLIDFYKNAVGLESDWEGFSE